MAGYSLVSNPGFLLKRSERHESLAKQIFACQKIAPDVPKVYVLPENIRRFFFFSYRYLQRRIGLEQHNASFTNVKAGTIVLQEDATDGDFYHELGHNVDYYNDREKYDEKSSADREFFASDFELEVRGLISKCGIRIK